MECETTVPYASLGMQMVCSELVKSDDWNRRTDEQQTDHTFEWIRSQYRHCHLKEQESREKEPPSKTPNNSEPLLDAQDATQAKTTKGRIPIQIVAEYELMKVSEELHRSRKNGSNK